MKSSSNSIFGSKSGRKVLLSGFTLVEIVLAIGIVSFSMIAILGTLPVGMETMHEAMVQAAKANISRELRGEFQQLSFSPNNAANIASLSGTNYYYSQEGMMLSGTANAYYKAGFSVGDGSVTSSTGDFTFQSDNASSITVTLSYPLVAPEANRKKTVFSLFAAKQKSN